MATTPPAFKRPLLPRNQFVLIVIGLLCALVFTTLILLISGTPVLETYQLVLFGWLSTPAKQADTLMVTAPLVLCAAGLAVTFGAGLYNLGIEGQVGLGAVGAYAVFRTLPGAPAPLVWLLAFVVAALFGALWALIAALLRRYGRVSEIFAGLGLNFLATGLLLYMIAGPWRKQGSASVVSTDQLPTSIWLPTLPGLRLAPAAPIIALLGLVLVWFLLSRSRWGLSVRAAGLNPSAAERLGVPTTRRVFEAMALCGALAGCAGAIQLLAVYHTLIPSISSGIGLLGLLVILLVNALPLWALPIALVFAGFSVGSLQLPLTLGVDSSIAGVLQGALVLFAVASRGFIRK